MVKQSGTRGPKRGRFIQLGIVPELDTTGPVDYSNTAHFAFNKTVDQYVCDQGSAGATTKEAAHATGHSEKSVAGRYTELHYQGKIARTEAMRDGCVVYVTKRSPT